MMAKINYEVEAKLAVVQLAERINKKANYQAKDRSSFQNICMEYSNHPSIENYEAIVDQLRGSYTTQAYPYNPEFRHTEALNRLSQDCDPFTK